MILGEASKVFRKAAIQEITPTLAGGILKFGFDLVVTHAAAEFESRPIQIPIFQEKVTHSYTNRPNFGPNVEGNHPIFPKFS